MTPLDLEHIEAQFGLMIREKENHDNYALLRLEDLDKVINYYNSFKDEFNSKSNGEKNEERKIMCEIDKLCVDETSNERKIEMKNKKLEEINEKILSVLTRLETVKQIQDKGDGDDNLET